MQPAFESWDLEPTPIPARSRLHSLEPIGIGTPFVESLTGYIVRLAASHAVRISDLIEHELRSSIPCFHAPFAVPNAINGISESARDWASAVEKSTLRQDLRLLTLLPFASLLTPPYLMRQERAWCPRCYESRRAQGLDVYEQLVWCLQSVDICPLHETPLENSCPACHQKLRPLAAVSRPGFCSRCRQWLGSAQRAMPTNSPTEYQVWAAREIANLLANSAQAKPVGRANIQKILGRYVDSFSEGNRMAIADIAGCRRTAFDNWYKGVTAARIDLLLRMCHELKIPMISLFTEAPPEAEATGFSKADVQKRRCDVCPRRRTEQIRNALQQAVTEQPAPSLGDIARRLGYTTTSRLYVADRVLCRMIVRNFNKSGRSYWWRRGGSKGPEESAIRSALEDSLSLEFPVAVYRIARDLGFETESPVTARFPDLCGAIKAKRAAARKARRDRTAAGLKSALNEDPPPTLEEVAKRLGYDSDNSIKALESRLCARLVERRRRLVERAKKALKKKLKAALRENPPPSMRKVLTRLGITEGVSYGNFPNIHRAIAARYRGFQRQAKSASG